MRTILFHMRAELRRRRRAWMMLALITGLGVGGSMAAAAGARRAATAYPRFVKAFAAADVTTGGSGAKRPIEEVVAALARRPEVLDSMHVWAPAFEMRTATGRRFFFDQVSQSVEPTGKGGRDMQRLKIVRGRAADARRADEATLSFVVDQPGLGLGSTVTPILPGLDERGPIPEVRIVGIHAAPGDLRSVNGLSFPGVVFTPAFFERWHEAFVPAEDGLSLAVGLRPGSAQTFADAARKTGLDVPLTMPDHVAGVQRTLRLEAGSLWILAAILAVAVLVVLGGTISRQAAVDAADYPIWRALGLSRSQIALSGALRAAVVGIVAAGIAIGVAYALSTLTPVGITRNVEPDPGARFDAIVTALGAALLIVVVSALGALSAARAVRTLTRPAAGSRRPEVAGRLAAAGLPPTIVTGVRMALHAGRGVAAAPVRGGIFGGALGIGALVTALVFAASIGHLIDTPRLSGYTWDGLADPNEEPGDRFDKALAASDLVEAFTRGGVWDLHVEGRRLLVMISQAGSGIEPAMLSGRVPVRADEIALGPVTMRELGVTAGATVRVQNVPSDPEDGPPGPVVPLKVVGAAVIPGFFFEGHEPGVGAGMTLDAFNRVRPDGHGYAYLIRFTDPADPRIEKLLTENNALFFSRQRPADLVTLEGVAKAGFVIAILLASIGAASLIHAIATSIRRRRRDLAILKTLGFSRGQVWRTVGWQALTMEVVAVAVGIPLGLAAGRFAWDLFANQLSVIPEYGSVGTLAYYGTAQTVLLIALLIAVIPGRAAARTRPAAILRTE